jgi:acetate kinase
MNGSILTLNAGSSSLKFALFNTDTALSETIRGEIENFATAPHFIVRDPAGRVLTEKSWPADAKDSFADALETLLVFADAHLDRGGLAAVGHRVVHGGAEHIAPARVTPALLTALHALIALDPLHMPHNLKPMQIIAARRPGLMQVACFDTAFHHTMPAVASAFALPREITAAGIRRYGFHGLSYEYVARRLRELVPDLASGKVIVAHLGAGASMCAMQNGVSIATTMGFSALEGLIMATRCGRLDPGVLLYLNAQGHSFADLEELLYRRSGLLGVSGVSGDVRTLLASDNPHACEAIELFTYQIAIEAGGLVSALGGLDGLIFTAGIGENAPAIRAAACERLHWLGLRIDERANAANAGCISAADSAVKVYVIATNEEAMIAEHTKTLGAAVSEKENGP